MTATLTQLPAAATTATVLDVELTTDAPSVDGFDVDGARVTEAWCVVRVATQPIGLVVVPVPPAGLVPAEVEAAVRERLAGELATRDVGVGRLDAAARDFLAGRAAALRDAPFVSAIVCTRDRPDALRRCLESLLRQEYPSYEIVVVDNAPELSATRETLAALGTDTVRWVPAPIPGLSHARTAGLADARGEILAWIDDDEEADEHWLAEIARAFSDNPRAVGMSGVVVPADVRTQAQRWYEDFGGHSKGRGFTPATFSQGTMAQSALYPLPPFGVGANMAFRAGVIEAVGGFDAALGAGTLAQGGEDTLVFTELLLGGQQTVYHPAALTRHHHRASYDELLTQMRGYGIGLTAFYTSLVLRHPLVLPRLLRLLPTALRDVRSGDSLRNQGLAAGFPVELMAANKQGILRGPVRYVQSRRQAAARVRAAREATHG